VALNKGRRVALCSLLLEVGSSDPSSVSFIGIIYVSSTDSRSSNRWQEVHSLML
jgi:hypothetical protein